METSPPKPRARTRRTTRRSVRVAERAARLLITAGGIGTILAVSLLFVYLVGVVLPLFSGAEVESERSLASPVRTTDESWLASGVDDYARVAWVLDRRGKLASFRLDTGELLFERELCERTPSAWVADSGGAIGFGYDDGSAMLGEVRFASGFIGEPDLSPESRALEVGACRTEAGGFVERVARDQWRRTEVDTHFDPPMAVVDGAAVVLLDFVKTSRDATIAAYSADGRLWLVDASSFENMFTGEIEYELGRVDLPLGEDHRGAPAHLLLNGAKTALFVAWPDGRLRRYDVRERAAASLVETVDLVAEPEDSLTALSFLTGRTTLLAGSARGAVDAWFVGLDNETGTLGFVRAHHFQGDGAAVRSFTASPRSRIALVGYADGGARLVQVTTERVLVELAADDGHPALAFAIAPREDHLVAFGSERIRLFDVDLAHPEATLSSLFAPVWYEGYARPEQFWQSTGGEDAVEPQLGLFPLVFGTLKATFYSMLFGVPLALLAAVFTSEFLTRRLRAPIQSAIELMASLPSVVLGFLAALVIAPWVQGELASVLAAIFTIPFTFLLGAHLYQLLPSQLAVRLAGWQRFVALIAMLLPGLWLASLLGPIAERRLFGGELEAWLDGQVGGAFGGFFVFLIPAGAVISVLASRRLFDPILQRRLPEWSRTKFGLVSLARFGGVTLSGLLLAALAASLLAGAGADPRGGAFGVGTYEQRNALVVGFVMGFAIVPIVYTLGVDALTSVPGHLREASYASGATRWQTAIHVVVPTAASGLYSACMIGLGRAVGETMIVLMATGSTPILEWNVFNGFRTLSANIAIELPEAVKGSTHYRTLFLAALLLFGMTFVLNTIAEFVRQRSRARFSQL